MTIELMRFIAPGRGFWKTSSARRDVAQVRRSLEYKIRSRSRLTPAEQYLARNLPRLENKLFAPTFAETANELAQALLRPFAMTAVCLTAYFALAGGLGSSSPLAEAEDRSRDSIDDVAARSASGDSVGADSAGDLTPDQMADQMAGQPVGGGSDQVASDDARTTTVASGSGSVDMPQLALAIATGYDQRVSSEEALLKQLVTAPAPSSKTGNAALAALPSNALPPIGLPAIEAPAEARGSLHAPELTESVTLRRYRNLVKFISGLIAAYRPTINDSSMIARHIVELSAEEDMDPIYVASVIAIESRFASDAQSNRGARGLMQLLPSTVRTLVKNASGERRFRLDGHLSDPRTNIKLGIDYLKQLQQKYRGNRYLALAAYNWGPANVDRVGGRSTGIPESVRNYSTTVLQRTVSWRRHFLRAIDTADDLQIARPATRRSAEG